MEPTPLNGRDVLRLAVASIADPKTIRSAYRGEPIRQATRERLSLAARRLGLPLPPVHEYEPGAQRHKDGPWSDE